MKRFHTRIKLIKDRIHNFKYTNKFVLKRVIEHYTCMSIPNSTKT